ncbi:MAG: indolepyruvate oxidoreductase subunit beta [Paludibacteraceae bacterium]|nr:indolepyruvate oxidoreductase subunit beta [Paludibacteraceae bacterium]
MKTDIILSGVGGQGILSIATVIGQAALANNLYIKQAEVHGMSQRGGDVQSNLRISDQPIASDLIALGQADVIISMEPLEALRYLPYLSKDGWIISSADPFVNIPNYPDIESVLAALRAHGNVKLIELDKIAKENNIARSANMILLGATAEFLGLGFEAIADSVRTVFGSKSEAVVEMNLRAIEIGRSFK